MKRHIIILLVSVTLSLVPLFVQLSGCSRSKALLTATYSDITAINGAIGYFKESEKEEIGARDLPEALVAKGYLRKLPVDQWGNPPRCQDSCRLNDFT